MIIFVIFIFYYFILLLLLLFVTINAIYCCVTDVQVRVMIEWYQRLFDLYRPVPDRLDWDFPDVISFHLFIPTTDSDLKP